MKLFENRRRVLEVSLVVFLLALSFALYLTIGGRRGKGEKPEGATPMDLRSAGETPMDLGSAGRGPVNRRVSVYGELSDGVNRYRLEDYERAALLLRETAETSRSRKARSLAHLYLGNIAYRQGVYQEALREYKISLSLDRRNPHACYNSALSALGTGDWRKALQFAAKSLNADRDFARGAVLAGDICRAAGKPDKAVEYFGKARGDGGIAKYNQGRVRLALGDEAGAEALLGEVAARADTAPLVRGLSRVSLGMMLFDGDEGDAIEHLGRALELFPYSPELRYDYALLLAREGRFEESLPHLKAVRDANTGGRVLPLLGIALFKSGKYRDALDFYLAIHEKAGDGGTASVIGDIYVKLGDREAAKRYYAKALAGSLSAGAGNRGAFVNLASIMVDEGNYLDALEACDSYLARFPDAGELHIVRARALFGLDSPGKAREALERAVSAAGEDAGPLLRAGALYRENGMQNNAVQVYQKVLARDPANYAALAGLAKTYARTGHLEKAVKAAARARSSTADLDLYYALSLDLADDLDADGAERAFAELIRDFPYRYESYHNYALFSIGRGRYEQAERSVEECIERNPSLERKVLSDLYTILGGARQGLGRLDEAQAAFQRARELNRGNKAALARLRRIEEERALREEMASR